MFLNVAKPLTLLRTRPRRCIVSPCCGTLTIRRMLTKSNSCRRLHGGSGLELTALSVRLADIDNSFAALGERSLDGLVITDDPSLVPLIPRLIAPTAERRLPAIYPFSDSVRRGGLMSYSANLFKLWQRAAGVVDRILKGARPAELPVQQATDVTLNINLKTAKALGLDIPMTLIARADEVIE
jgi:putative ABC transport system substrate-binding protein